MLSYLSISRFTYQLSCQRKWSYDVVK